MTTESSLTGPRTVGLGAPTQVKTPVFDPKLPGAWLVDLSHVDMSRVKVAKDKWVDLDFLADTRPELERAIQLTKRMQGFFREWHEAGGREFRDSFVTLFPYLLRISDELSHEFEEDALREKSRADLQFLEAFAVAIFAKAAQLLPDTKIERRQPINPYAISWERDGLFDGTGPSQREARQLTKGLQFAWLDEFGGDS